jgi:molybdopterin converting factor small subunit
VKVTIPQPLHSYTKDGVVAARGGTVGELLSDLDRQYPGIRFRMLNEQDALRPHIKIFVNRKLTRDLATTLREDDEVQILQALSARTTRCRSCRRSAAAEPGISAPLSRRS